MRTYLSATLAVLALGTSFPAQALNEDVMRNILSPIFLAQNLTAVCMRINPDFARETGGKDGDADKVITHMKDEILATMTREEAAPIVVSAAGAARAVGLGMIRALSGGTVEEQTDRVRALCEETAKPIVRGVVENHDERHEFFEQMLREARQGRG
jgi:AcrR family transcriptional regulator